MGSQAPKKIVVPKNTVRLDEANTEREEIIDDVRYICGRVTDTEIDFLLTIGLPDQGIYIAQDLIYSGTHLYLYARPQQDGVPAGDALTKDMEHWIVILEELLKSDYEVFLPGHGFIADKVEVARNVEYLAAAKHAIDTGVSKYDFKSFMLQRYPARQCPAIFDTYLSRLFDGARDF
jgi:hypothetical protein